MVQSVSFEFTTEAIAGDEEPLRVVNMAGEEGLSKPYRFTLDLMRREPIEDVDRLLREDCTLTLTVGEDTRHIHGVLAHFEEQKPVGDHTLYQAVLVPRLWKLSLFHTNEVYIDQNVPETLADLLETIGLQRDIDYELSLSDEYRDWPFRCQYDETHLNFLQRITEREGIYYFFEQGEESERIIFCDDRGVHEDINRAEVEFAEAAGFELAESRANIHALVCRQQRMPAKVVLKDYNPENPSVDIKAEADVDADGSGEVFLFGDNIRSSEEAKSLAQARAEGLQCRKKQFHGEGMAAPLEPGYCFTLLKHPRSTLNQRYLVTDVEHQGRNPNPLHEPESDKPVYSNSFSLIPAELQYRPEQTTPKPRYYGATRAHVDGEGEGEYAHVDDYGRYKIVLPFDRTARGEAKASAWVRMAQPFSGENEGMHFPLRKDAEVLLTFVDGDPDRPIISGAVPNHKNVSVVTRDNSTQSRIQSRQGNKIEVEDNESTRRIKFYTPHKNTYMHLGAPNHEGDGWVVLTDGIERKQLNAGLHHTIRTEGVEENPETDKGTSIDLDDNKIEPTNLFKFRKLTLDSLAGTTPGLPDTNNCDDLSHDDELKGDAVYYRRKGDRYNYVDGETFNFADPEAKVFNFGNSYEVNHWRDFGTIADPFPTCIPGVQFYSEQMKSGSSDYDDADKTGEIKTKAHVVFGIHDTFNYQEGNIYDFGGYWEYSIGNGYEEDHIETDDLEINPDNEYDLLASGGPNVNTLKKTLGDDDDDLFSTFGLAELLEKKENEIPSFTGAIKGEWSDIQNFGVAGSIKEFGEDVANLPETIEQLITGEEGGDDDSGPSPGSIDDLLEVGKTATSKTFLGQNGATYDYTKGGRAIEVTEDVDTLDINKGGLHIEVGFNGQGKKTSWTRAGRGQVQEKKWHPKTGKKVFDAHKVTLKEGVFNQETTWHPSKDSKLATTITSTGSHGIQNAEWKYDPTSGIPISFSIGRFGGGVVEGSYNLSDKATSSICLGAEFAFDVKANVSVGINLKLSFDFEYTAMAGLSIEGKHAGSAIIELGKTTFKAELATASVALDMNPETGKVEFNAGQASMLGEAGKSVLTFAGFEFKQ